MKKIALLLGVLLIMMIPVVSAAFDYGFYYNDIQQVEANDFAKSDITHVRDDYYAIAYQGTGSDGYLNILEIDDNYDIVNASVDKVEFDGTYLNTVDMISMNKETGLTVMAYSGSDSGDSTIIIKSFQIYENGTITIEDTHVSSTFHFWIKNEALTKTSNSTFLIAGIDSNYGNTKSTFFGGSVTSDGTLSMSMSDRYYENTAINNNKKMFLNKLGSTCTLYSESGADSGIYTTIGCSDTSFSSGGDSAGAATGTSSSTFEANEINYLRGDFDDSNNFTYLAYTETLDNYPVITVIDEETHTVLDKIRFEDSTASYTDVLTLAPSNVLVSYTMDGNLHMKSYSVAADGTLNSEYNRTTIITASGFDAANVYNESNQYIGSYTGASGDALTFGVGLIPPPEPSDTQVTLKDEKTLGTFDTSNKTLTFYAHCENNTNYQTTINETTTSVPVNCEYEDFSLKVEYTIDDISFSYRRYYIRDLDDTYNQFDLDVYLVNPYTTDFVYNEMVVDDLTVGYTDPKLYFNKNIDGTTTQITASDLDTQNSMMGILMNGETYDVYLESNETGRIELGDYRAPPAGTTQESTVFHLYDIILKPNTQRLSNLISFYVYSKDNQIEYAVQTVEGVSNNIINATLTLYNGTGVNDTIIETYEVGASSYDPDNLYPLLSGGPFNYSDYKNTSVFGELHYYFADNGQIRQNKYTTQLWSYNEITLPLSEYVSQSFIDWFILILLSVIALYATIETANIAAMGIIFLASIFVIFGWFSMSIGTLALAALIALGSLLKKRGEERV